MNLLDSNFYGTGGLLFVGFNQDHGENIEINLFWFKMRFLKLLIVCFDILNMLIKLVLDPENTLIL